MVDAGKTIRDIILKGENGNNPSLPEGGFVIPNTHFENGRHLHTETYYYVKRFFQNSKNCETLLDVFQNRLNSITLLEPNITFIGFRHYTELFLNMAVSKLNAANEDKKYSYGIVELQKSGDFDWVVEPKSVNTTFVIVLPITCTFSTYWKIKEFVSKSRSAPVSDKLITLFSILHKDLDVLDEVKDWGISKKNDFTWSHNGATTDGMEVLPESSELYSSFNWSKIEPHSVTFKKDDTEETDAAHAHSVIRLYTKFYFPEECQLCYPQGDNLDGLKQEKPLFPTHSNFETPKLIFDLPARQQKKRSDENSNETDDFFDKFGTIEGGCRILHYGHVSIHDSRFQSYIRPNEFFKNNQRKDKRLIQDWFEGVFQNQNWDSDPVKKFVFISEDTSHDSSNFLEKIAAPFLETKGKEVNILRFDPNKEFLTNIIALHGHLLPLNSHTDKNLQYNEERTILVYYTDVLSRGESFKLLSDYLKHHMHEDSSEPGCRGFDHVMTLVDRTSNFSKNEIVRKIRSQESTERFLAYTKLNIPILSALHLGNPYQERIKFLDHMLHQSGLDTVRLQLLKELRYNQPVDRRELRKSREEEDQNDKHQLYFPFVNTPTKKDGNEWFNEFNLFYGSFNFKAFQPKARQNLLKLYLEHQINNHLPTFESGQKLNVEELIETIWMNSYEQLQLIFTNTYELPKNCDQIFDKDWKANGEKSDLYLKVRAIVEEQVIRILCGHPFIYHKHLYDATFHHVLIKLANLIEPEKSFDRFEDFRKLKFYIRCSVRLNSNFILSGEFIEAVRNLEANDWAKDALKACDQQIDTIREIKTDDSELDRKKAREAAILTLEYKKEQIRSFFPFLLYCYKDLLAQNPYRSLRLENVLSSAEKGLKAKEDLQTPFFHFMYMLRLENSVVLDELKKLHLKKLESKDTKPLSLKSYLKLTEPNIGRVKRLVVGTDTTKRPVKKMLHALNLIHKKDKKNSVVAGDKKRPSKNDAIDFNQKIRDVLDKVIAIVSEEKLKYTLFVKYKESAPSETDPVGGIYRLSSQGNLLSGQVGLQKDGLIWHLLQGMEVAGQPDNIQTLICALKDGNEFKTFDDEYSLVSIKKPEDEVGQDSEVKSFAFNKLVINDANVAFDNDTQMFMAIRLSSTEKNEKGEDTIVGKAVLVITSNKSEDAFSNFINSSKMRSLLLIREELTAYLDKQFSGDVFEEVLSKEGIIKYQKNLGHGIETYLQAQKSLWDDLVQNDYNENFSKSNLVEEFELVQKAILGQVIAYDDQSLNLSSNYQLGELKKRLTAILQSRKLAGRRVWSHELQFSIPYEELIIRLPVIILEVVLLEYLINVRKHRRLTFNDDDLTAANQKVQISFIKNETLFTIEISNSTHPNKHDNSSSGYGQEMCKEIVNRLAGVRMISEVVKGRHSIKIEIWQREFLL